MFAHRRCSAAVRRATSVALSAAATLSLGVHNVRSSTGVQRRFLVASSSSPAGPSSSSPTDDGRRVDHRTSTEDGACDLEGLLIKRSPEELERTRRTTEFVNAVCTTPHNQLAIDMICAAMKVGTLKEAHLSAILRRLKVLEAELANNNISPETPSTASAKSPTASRSLPDPPIRRMFSILTTVLLEGYASKQRDDDTTAYSEKSGVIVPPTAVSSAIFNHALLWFLHPFVLKVKAEEVLDNFTDCSKSAEDDIEDQDEEDIHETRRMVGSAVSHSASRIPVEDIWRYVALLELHGIPIDTEIALDALALALRAEAATYRSAHSGENSPVEMEYSQHRLEFLDRQRNSLRERLEHRRIVAASSGTTSRLSRRSAPQPHREMATVSES